MPKIRVVQEGTKAPEQLVFLDHFVVGDEPFQEFSGHVVILAYAPGNTVAFIYHAGREAAK